MRRVHLPPAGRRAAALAIFIALAGAGSVADAADKAPSALQQRPVPANADAAAGALPAAERATQRVEALMEEVARLRADTLEQRHAIEQLRLRAAAAESGERLLRALALLLSVVSALAVWLVFKLRRAIHAAALSPPGDRPGEAPPVAATSPPAALPVPAAPPPPRPQSQPMPIDEPSGFSASSSTGGELAPAAPPRSTAPAPAGAGRSTYDPYTTAAMPRPMSASMFDLSGAGPLDALSVDEQLDLEQQAEFFIAIGQEEAAIELLQGSVRAGRGADPLPYLKLLRLHARRNDRDAYERTALRFARRYNARVPACGEPLDVGRGLEQYPQVLAELATAWREPAAALALLQALLLRAREGAAALAPPFELPAFEELVLLHQLSRLLGADEVSRAADEPASGHAHEHLGHGGGNAGRNFDGVDGNNGGDADDHAVVDMMETAARALQVDVLLPLGEEERVLRDGESPMDRTQVLPRWRP